jgi:hypothetical protein
VKLDGSKSQDPNNRPLTFYWIGAETNPAPVTLPNVAMPEFTPPSPGKYIFILYVDNGLLASAPDQVKIEVAEPDIYVSKSRPIEPNKVFRTLRDALTAAQTGFLIFVEPGEYVENVDNFKSNIILLSTDPIKTILNGRQGNTSTLRVRNVEGVEIAASPYARAAVSILCRSMSQSSPAKMPPAFALSAIVSSKIALMASGLSTRATFWLSTRDCAEYL